jgi:hypothetical protein
MICLIAFGVVIFTVTLKALKEHSFFGCRAALVVAICVTILSLIGIHEFCVGPEGYLHHNIGSTGDGANDGIHLLLLPYTVLGLAILLFLLLAAIRLGLCFGKRLSSKPAGPRSVHAAGRKRGDGERRFKILPTTTPQKDKNFAEDTENERQDRLC